MNTEYALTPSAARALTAALNEPSPLLRRLARRLRAIARLVARRRRAWRRDEELRNLDEATLRDLGVSRRELAAFASGRAGRADAARRRAELDVWLSASSRFRVRSIDSSL